jgi:hypothetical protein
MCTNDIWRLTCWYGEANRSLLYKTGDDESLKYGFFASLVVVTVTLTKFCALKLDTRKAYDHLEWEYLRAIVVKLGFHRIRVDMVMRLVSTVSFSTLL